jgi:hypothetical protein
MLVAGPESSIAAIRCSPPGMIRPPCGLWSYVSNLQREDSSSSSIVKNVGEVNVTKKNRLLKPAKSLVYFLTYHKIQEADADLISSLSEPLQRAVVQAIRIASPLNDYRLILNLVDGVWHYCNSQRHNKLPGVLDPRIIGEVSVDWLDDGQCWKNQVRLERTGGA